MKSPFENIDAAFDVMFTEAITVMINRNGNTHKQTIKANVFLDNTELPLDENIMDSNLEQILIICKPKDWAFCKTLQRGDDIIRNDGRKYNVMSVNNDELMGYVITARKK
jgi:hypothetical protein